MSKLTIYIVRHGKTLMNTLDMVQGWCDSPLTDAGIEVAEHLGLGMKGIEFRSAYCSDLRRTLSTAQTVLKSKGQEDVPITELEGLREACFGSFEAHPNENMWGNAALYLKYRNRSQMEEAMVKGEISYREMLDTIHKLDTMSMAETYSQVESRTQTSLHQIIALESSKGDGNILVISHGVSIVAMLMSLGGDKLFTEGLDNAAVCKVIAEDDKITVESMGDMTYVQQGKLAK